MSKNFDGFYTEFYKTGEKKKKYEKVFSLKINAETRSFKNGKNPKTHLLK